jgi:hypothetical protein
MRGSRPLVGSSSTSSGRSGESGDQGHLLPVAGRVGARPPVGLERGPGDEFVAVVEVGAGTDAGQQVQALLTEEVGQWFCPTQG